MIEPRSAKPILLVTARTMRTAGCTLKESLALTHKFLLIETLTAHGGNICHAAKALHVHRNTIGYYLKLLHLSGLPRELRKSATQIHSQMQFNWDGKRAAQSVGMRRMARAS